MTAIVKKIAKWLMVILGGLVLLVLLLAGYTQTQFFRDQVRSFALSKLSALLNAEVHLGRIGGNLVTGFTVDSVAISVHAMPLLNIDRIEIEFNLFALPARRIEVGHLTFVRPAVMFRSDRTGTWNLPQPVGADSAETSTGGGFDWAVALADVEIIDGSVGLIDSSALLRPGHGPVNGRSVEYHNFLLTDLELALKADLHGPKKHVRIENLSFNSSAPHFNLRKLSGSFLLTDSGAQVANLTILTKESSIDLDASMAEFDLLGGIDLADLRTHPISLSLRNSDISLEELSMFIPDIDFLRGTVAADLEAGGTFGEVQIRKLDLVRGETVFHVTGGVYNLQRPNDLYLDVRFRDSRIASRDAIATLPDFHLPDLRSLGVSDFDLVFEGKPRDFRTKITVANRAGKVGADVHLAVGGPNTLTYSGMTEFHNFDLSPLLDDDGMASALNGTAQIEGAGVDFEHLAGTMDVTIDSSAFLGNVLHSSQFKLNVQRDEVEGTVRFGLGSLGALLSTRVERILNDRPVFSVSGLVTSLDLGELLHDTHHSSNITMRLDAEGKGLRWDNMSGDFRIDFRNSRYLDYQVDSGSVMLVVRQDDPLNKEIRVTSDIADISVTGRYDLQYLLDLISFERANLSAAAKAKFAILDSSLARSEEGENLDELAAGLSSREQQIDAEVMISIKDLEPVSFLTGEKRFDGVGSLTGRVRGSYSHLSVLAELDAQELFYGNVGSGFYIQGGSIGLDLEDLVPGANPLDSVKAKFTVEAGNLHLNRTRFDSLQASIFLENGSAQFAASGGFDGAIGFLIGGQALVSTTGLLIEPQQMQLEYKGDHWSLSEGALLQFRSDGASFENIVMKSDTQAVSIDGRIGEGGELAASLHVDRIGLDVLEDLFKKENSPTRNNLIGGTASVAVNATGTFSEPVLNATLEAQDLTFRTLLFGELSSRAEYRDGAVSLSLNITEGGENEAAEPRLIVEGTFPLALPFGKGTSDGRFDLSVRSDGLQINFLDPLVPTFDDLSGILRCNLKITGAPDDLQYDGSFSLAECSFIFRPNNIRYRFSGEFEPKGTRIRVVTAVAQNITADDKPGRHGEVRFSGDFALENFVPTDFNLVATGELLVVRPESRQSSLPLYGELYIETGKAGLSFTGTIEHSFLRGELLMRRSRLILPPVKSTAAGRSEFSVPIVVLDDTSRTHSTGERSFRERYFAGDQTADTLSPEPPRKSFLDGVEYDLTVETSGPSSEIRLIFSELPVEELEATFQGKWTITGDGTRWIGDLTIDRAQYTFFKQFDAVGRLRYTGEFMNPELDITASYQSTRTVTLASDSSTKTEKVVVLLKITGTRREPKQEMSMTIDDIDYYSYSGPKSSDLESDAIAFILAGNFPLSRPESNTIASNLQTTLGASMVVGASSLLTKELSEYLRKETGFITSVELGYESQGSFSESADIRLSGTAFKGYWRYRGTILDNPFNNANVSLLYSFGDIFDNPSFRNFMFELERRTEIGTSGLIDDRKEVNSARLFYRFSF